METIFEERQPLVTVVHQLAQGQPAPTGRMANVLVGQPALAHRDDGVQVFPVVADGPYDDLVGGDHRTGVVRGAPPRTGLIHQATQFLDHLAVADLEQHGPGAPGGALRCYASVA